MDDSYEPADEGGSPRNLPPIKGHAGLARHIATSLVADEFDMPFFQKKGLDHGCFSPLSMMFEDISQWPCAIVPLQIGVLQFPVPSAGRCYKLGQSLRKAIESYEKDISVVVAATGGLSHQVHGERCGFNNTEWDEKFLDLIANDPVKLTQMTISEYATLGGLEESDFVLEKLDAAVGVSNLHIYAAMRGQTLEDFQKTRNVSVQYSVAGGENAAKLSEFSDSSVLSQKFGKKLLLIPNAHFNIVIPAKAGIQRASNWTPAFAGVTLFLDLFAGHNNRVLSRK